MSKIPESVRVLLHEQYKHELRNHLRYETRASFATFRGLDGFAKFLRAQAEGELGHARRVLAYLEDRNDYLPAGAVATLSSDDPFDPAAPDLSNGRAALAIFSSSLAIEEDTTERLKTIHAVAEAANDLQTCAWLVGPDGLVAEQTEEENVVQTILDRFASRAVDGDWDGAAIHDLDVWVGETFGG